MSMDNIVNLGAIYKILKYALCTFTEAILRPNYISGFYVRFLQINRVAQMIK